MDRKCFVMGSKASWQNKFCPLVYVTSCDWLQIMATLTISHLCQVFLQLRGYIHVPILCQVSYRLQEVGKTWLEVLLHLLSGKQGRANLNVTWCFPPNVQTSCSLIPNSNSKNDVTIRSASREIYVVRWLFMLTCMCRRAACTNNMNPTRHAHARVQHRRRSATANLADGCPCTD